MADNAPATLTSLLRQSGLYQPEDIGDAWRDWTAEGVASTPTPTTGDLAVTQRAAGANMSVDVAPGVGWVHQDLATPKPGPAYRVRFASTVNLTLAAAHATLARIDRVVLEVFDAAYSGLTNLGQVRVITGTPAASPAAPALPSTAIPLATIAVAAAATSVTNANITDERRLAGTPGDLDTPRLGLRRVTAQNLASAAFISIAWDTQDEDTNDMWVAATNTVVTFKTPGVYMAVAQFGFASNATGYRYLDITQAGSVSRNWRTLQQATNGNEHVQQTVANRIVAARGDTLICQVVQGSGVLLAQGPTGALLDVTMLSRRPG